jgi:NADPH:quinone reductase-like Zn-dependent oxidoreductase
VDAARIGERVLVVPTLEQATWRERTILDERNAVPVDADGDPLQLAMLGINPITAHSLSRLRKARARRVGRPDGCKLGDGSLRPRSSQACRPAHAQRGATRSVRDVAAGCRRRVVLVEGDDLAKQAADAIGDAPLELIIDGVAGDPVAQLAPLLKTGGQIVSYTARGRQPLSISILDLIFRGRSVHGYWLNLWLQSTPRDTVAQTYRELGTLVAGGTLAAPVEATYGLADYRDAIAHAAHNDRNGKVLFALG